MTGWVTATKADERERCDDDRLDDPRGSRASRVAPLLELEPEEREDDERREHDHEDDRGVEQPVVAARGIRPLSNRRR